MARTKPKQKRRLRGAASLRISTNQEAGFQPNSYKRTETKKRTGQTNRGKIKTLGERSAFPLRVLFFFLFLVYYLSFLG